MGRVKRGVTLEERLHQKLEAIRAAEAALERDFVALTERAARLDRPTAFGGLGDHGSSSDASGLGQEKARQGSLAAGSTVADAVEAYLFQYRLDRTSRDDRRRALDAVLSARPDWDALLSDEDRRRILDAFAMNPEADDGPSLISGAPVRGSEAAKAALAETTRTLYGSAQAEALALGGGDLGEGTWRYHRLRTIAKSKGLRLDRPDQRQFAETQLYDEIGASASQARTWDEGMRSLVRAVETLAGRRLNCAEADPQDVARRLIELRPDLAEDYRGERDKPAPGRKPHDDSGETLKLTALAELRAQDVPCTEENIRKAKIAVARLHPELVPGSYGRGKK